MKRALLTLTAIGLLAGCVTMTLAPGADQVKITRNAADVTGCRAVGNVSANSGPLDLNTELRNKTLGLGGNVLFTTGLFSANEGVAYRCN